MTAKRLHIAPSFTLPLDAITTSSATFGIRGSGKTNTNVVMVEEFLANGLQVAIIDPTDVWWGLKSSKDGTKAGYPVIVLGGRHGDLPLAGGDGGTIADFVVDTGASVILSLRHFEADAEKRRLITDFARRLYHRKGQQDAPTPIMVVVDEASLVVPQFVGAADAPMVGAIQRLVRQGRSSGIGVNLIDARPATVNKDVLAGVEMLITHRVTSPKDRKALLEYVEQHDPDGRAKEFLGELAALGEGEAWFWSPSFLSVFERVKVRVRRTFDSSRTPKAGETAIVPVKMADIDLEAVRAKLGQSIEKAKADDPKELKKKVAELEAQLRKAGTVTGGAVRESVQAAVAEAVAKAVEQERADAIRRTRNTIMPWKQYGEDLRRTVEKMGKLGSMVASYVNDLPAPPTDVPTAEPPITIKQSVAKVSLSRAEVEGLRALRVRAATAPQGATALAGARLKLARALAELEAIGVTEVPKKQLAFYAGISLAGGYGSNTLSAMRTDGLVEYPRDGCVSLTDDGRAAVGSVDAPDSLDELHARIRTHLSGLEVKIFDAIVQMSKGSSLTKEELGERVGASFAGGYGSNTLSALRTAGIVDYPQKGMVGPSDLLFPDSLI